MSVMQGLQFLNWTAVGKFAAPHAIQFVDLSTMNRGGAVQYADLSSMPQASKAVSEYVGPKEPPVSESPFFNMQFRPWMTEKGRGDQGFALSASVSCFASCGNELGRKPAHVLAAKDIDGSSGGGGTNETKLPWYERIVARLEKARERNLLWSHDTIDAVVYAMLIAINRPVTEESLKMSLSYCREMSLRIAIRIGMRVDRLKREGKLAVEHGFYDGRVRIHLADPIAARQYVRKFIQAYPKKARVLNISMAPPGRVRSKKEEPAIDELLSRYEKILRGIEPFKHDGDPRVAKLARRLAKKAAKRDQYTLSPVRLSEFERQLGELRKESLASEERRKATVAALPAPAVRATVSVSDDDPVIRDERFEAAIAEMDALLGAIETAARADEVRDIEDVFVRWLEAGRAKQGELKEVLSRLKRIEYEIRSARKALENESRPAAPQIVGVSEEGNGFDWSQFHRPMTARDVVGILTRNGFVRELGRGGHITYVYKGGDFEVKAVVPMARGSLYTDRIRARNLRVTLKALADYDIKIRS